MIPKPPMCLPRGSPIQAPLSMTRLRCAYAVRGCFLHTRQRAAALDVRHVSIIGASGVCAFVLAHSQPDGLSSRPPIGPMPACLCIAARRASCACRCLCRLRVGARTFPYGNTRSDGTRACIVRCTGVPLRSTARTSVRTHIRSTVRTDVRLPSCGASSARARGCHGPAPGYLC